MVYGDVTLNNTSNSLELTELQNESSDLRDTLHVAELDLQRLRTENESKTWECTELLSQLSESRVEVERMRSEIDEVRKRVEVTVAKEEEIRVLKAELEKVRKQRDCLELSNDAVKTSAVSNLRLFLKRVKTLEDNVASLMDNSNSSGSLVDHFR